MRRQRWWMPLLAIVFITNWKSTLTLPVPDEEVDSSTKLLGSSVVTSVSVVTGSSENGTPLGSSPVTSTADRRRVIPSKDLPGSPAGLLRPDRFQFYTFNKDGNVVTKQMTEKEIQGLIAAGGGHLPIEIHEPQSAGDVLTGGMKVADVVQNVQKVLKGELSKPATVMTSVPTIPGHVNTEWSSILPSILGGESETASVSETEIGDTSIVPDTTIIKKPASHTATTNLPAKQPTVAIDYETKKKPTVISETEIHSEKPMIQVPVITVEQKLPAHLPEEDTMPVFQMLNTISADKVKSKNHTNIEKPQSVQPSKTVFQGHEENVSTPEKISAKPTFVEAPIIEQSTSVNDKLPEMVEITFNSGNVQPEIKKPASIPELPMKHSETIFKSPVTEIPATMSVVSETHSTSMKVSGHGEIPLRESVKPVDRIHVTTERKPEKVTEKPIDEKLDLTTIRAKVTTEQATTEKPAELGLFAQGVSFFGNLPEAISSMVSDLIPNNAHVKNSDTKQSQSESVEMKDTPKIPESTIGPTKETNVGKEPVYQMIPEIIPDKRVPPHGATPSEASSIEHIIETLNDPTGSISGTVAAEHFVVPSTAEKQVNVSKVDASDKTANLAGAQTSTKATPISVEVTMESNSAKPVDPLPTELADSLSSMIFQVSDAMPSVLPVSPDAGFDATEKKSGNNMTAEEAVVEEKIQTTEVPVVAKTPEETANRIALPVQAESDKPAVIDTKVSESTISAIPEASTEKMKEILNANDSPFVTESSIIHISTTVKNDLPMKSTIIPETSTNKVDLPVAEKLKVSALKPEKLNPEADEVPASSDITTDKVTPAVKPVENTETKDTIERIAIQERTTAKPAAIISSSSTSTILSDQTEIPTTVKAETVAAIVQETSMPEDQKEEAPSKIDSNENKTEPPIVRLDITEAKPTGFKVANSSQEKPANADNETESPLVRIQLMANPVTLINNMIESATVETSPPSVEPLSLPETGSVSPNTIASGLIAGYPSTTDQTITSNSDIMPEVSSITVESVKSEPGIQLVNDAPAKSGAVEDPKTPQVVNLTKIDVPETPVIAKETITEKIEVSEVSTSKDSLIEEVVVPVERIDLKESITAESTEKTTTLQADSLLQTSTTKPEEEDKIVDVTTTKIAEVEASTSPPKLVDLSLQKTENVSEIVQESTIKKDEVEDPENRIQLPVFPIVAKPVSDEKINETFKLIENSVSTSAKPEISTSQSEAEEMKIKVTTMTNAEKSGESSNSTKSEIPVVRIEAASESSMENVPSRIQLTDLPIVGTTASPKKPSKDESIQTFLTNKVAQSVTTMQSPVESTENSSKASSNVSLQTTTLSPGKLEEPTNKPEVSDTVAASSNSSENLAATQQTEEIRIQVNETAVWVTKRPVSETSGQKAGVTDKTPGNHEHVTTPKIATTTEVSSEKLEEKEEQRPVKLPESSSSKNASMADLAINKVVAGASETETRIRLGDEQSDKVKVTSPTKLDDPRKPIKKNNDSPLSIVKIEDPIKLPAVDSTGETSTKVELTTSASKEKTSAPKITVLPTKLQEKQPSGQKEGPVRVTAKPTPRPAKPSHKPMPNIKKDDAIPKPTDEKWTLIPQQVYPALTKTGSHSKRPITQEAPAATIVELNEQKNPTERPTVPLDHSMSASGLDSTVRNQETDISYFVNLCNELAFSFWSATNKGLSTARSLAVSPFGMTSMLAMVFLGARGPTSDQMNDILRLDDVASFNPHLVFQNVTDAVGLARNQGIANAAFVRELFADRSKVRKLMPFYKEQAQQFYDGIVAEVNFATISDLVRRRTNLMIRKQTGGRIKDFVRTNTVPLRSPLAALSANVFQTDCNSSAASSEGRDGELYFAVSPAVRQRKLVPVPATVWRAGVLAGYEPNIDATAIALGGVDKLVSTIFIMPGQQGFTAPGDTLDRLEQRLVKGAAHEGAWNKLLKVLIPRPGLELQIPKFSHRSVINATAALKRMGLEELFSKHADLKGINGVATDLHLADVLQMNLFSTCGDENIISGRHHVEVYPGSPLRNARDYHESEEETDDFVDESDKEQDGFSRMAKDYNKPTRQIDDTEKPRLKLDRPFLYFVRHNPTGLILHMGRFNPRLLP